MFSRRTAVSPESRASCYQIMIIIIIARHVVSNVGLLGPTLAFGTLAFGKL